MQLNNNDIIKNQKFISLLMDWYSQNKRDFPWRKNITPYNVWVSEIIMQQTQIKKGLPYYVKFITKYPNIIALGNDDLDNILRLWQGLGYYRRAVNMHICAQQIVNEFNGIFPTQYSQLIKLKGIGKYTASAIASICFNEATPTVDGNVFRFISRYFGFTQNISKSNTYLLYISFLKTIIPTKNSGDFNQAMMEYGATVCKPKSPLCHSCMFNKSCYAKSNDMVSILPIRSIKKAPIPRCFYYCFIIFKDKIWIKKRMEDDIWKGLYDSILIEKNKNQPFGKKTFRQFTEIIGVKENDIIWKYKKKTKQQLTHQLLYIHLVCAFISTIPPKFLIKNYLQIPIKDINNYPFPIVIANYLNKIVLSKNNSD